MKQVTYIPGEGIGPEVTGASIKIIKATRAPIEFVQALAGEAAFKKWGTPIPEELINQIYSTRVCLKGPLTNQLGKGYESPNHLLRRGLNLYASVRPAKSFRGIKTPFPDIEITVIMANMEGPDSGIDRYLGGDREIAEHIDVITKQAVERILRFGFNYAKEHGKKLALVHLADQMKSTGGLWLQTAEEIAREYTDIRYDSFLADNMAQLLVTIPQEFKLIIGSHLYGDIFSDLCGGLVGSVGMVPVIDCGEEDIAMFETAHGTAPGIAGKNLANPTSSILAGKYMLEHLGYVEEANRIDRALTNAFADGRVLTSDLGGSAGTEDFTNYVIKFLQ